MKKRHTTCSRLNRFGWWLFSAALALPAWAVVPTGLHAQAWNGGATLGVQIRGAGGPVAGAIVSIRRQPPGPKVGPESRKTDSRGQANFVGITQGGWSLEIKHPDYLSFVASIHVRPGKKPEVLTQFLEASGPGRGTFRVKFLRSDQPLGEALPGTAASAPATDRPLSMPVSGFDRSNVQETEPRESVRARAVPTQIVTPVPQPQAPISPAAPVDTVEPVEPVEPASNTPDGATPKSELEAKPPTPAAEVPIPLDRPIAQPTPAAPSPVEGPSISARTPVAEIRPEVPLEPVAEPAASSSGPPSVPTPDELPEAAPEPEPMPAPIPPGPEAPESDTILVPVSAGPPVLESAPESLRAYRDRSCFECKPGEWAVAVQLDVPSGKACRTTAEVAVRRAMRDVAASASGQLADFSGPLPLDLAVFPLSTASLAARNTLTPYLEPTASCRFLAVVVPQEGRFTGFRFEALDANTAGTCTGEEECEIGQARFLFSPGIARGTGASIIYSIFENTGGTARIARMTGFFVPASGWAPE